MIWGAIIVSLSISISFFGALVYSYISKDQPNAALLVNSVVINMSLVVGYWLGSSVGSARKTELMNPQPKP